MSFFTIIIENYLDLRENCCYNYINYNYINYKNNKKHYILKTSASFNLVLIIMYKNVDKKQPTCSSIEMRESIVRMFAHFLYPFLT